MTVAVPRSTSFEQARDIAGTVESTVQEAIPRADVVVQIDPVVKDENSLVERVWSVAARQGVGVHAIRLHDVRGHLSLGLHLEVPDGLTIGAAHDRASAFERTLRAEAPEIAEIVTHIEPVGDEEVRRPASHERSQEVLDAVLALPHTVPSVRDCHRIAVHREGDELAVSFHCLVDPELPVGQAHRLTVQLESALRAKIPELGRVIIHVEPPEGDERREPAPP
jgi:divalent metal cation (Fe/Co/Zn/Cd) transporter